MQDAAICAPGTHMPPNANDRDVETRRSAHRLGREFVGERQRVEGDGQARIEQTLKREHGDPHGAIDPKVGVYACTSFRRRSLVSGSLKFTPKIRETENESPGHWQRRQAAHGRDRKRIMPKEVPHTLQLYLEGKIEQFFFTEDKPGVVFLMNAASSDEAKATICALPLAAFSLMSSCRSGRSSHSGC
jgi:hypothetical protein